MKKPLSALLALLLLLLAACGGSPRPADSAPASGADYPKKPITMIVPYSAGGTTDLTGRQLAAALEKRLGVSVVVENIAGASGSVGARAALDAEPDGYTVLFTADSLGTQRVMGISEMSYGDFSPIVAVGDDPKVMVVGKDSPYGDIHALLDAMKANPGRVKMSYTGPGGSGHVQALILNRFGYAPALTAYAGGSDCLAALLGGQVDFTNSNYSTVTSFLESGELRMLAVCATEPLPAHPEVPTLLSCLPGSDALLSIPYTPTSLVVDKDVPEGVLKTLRDAAADAVRDSAFEQYMSDNCVRKLYEEYPAVEDILRFYREWESTVSWLLYDAGAAVNSPEDFNIPRP